MAIGPEQRTNSARLRELHNGPQMLIMPNAWDCVSARIFEQAGFAAIATTSGGMAAVLGYPDGQHISAKEMLQLSGRIARSVSVPVTADLEAGYGLTPTQVAGTISQAMQLGLVGANIEDGRGPGQPLADLKCQIEIIQAIRKLAQDNDLPFVLNMRVDTYLYGTGDPINLFKQTVERAQAYCAAGADCIYPIGLKDNQTIARLVKEVPCPINIMAGPGAPEIQELADLGVRRVTWGTAPMRAILPFVSQLAHQLKVSGKSPLLEQTEFSHATVNQLFNH